MIFFTKKQAVICETEAKLNPVQLTEDQVDQVSGGSNDFAPIGSLFNFSNSGAAQETANKHHPAGGGFSFSDLHLEF